jgi:cellulose biosynthesis protein BcsQ
LNDALSRIPFCDITPLTRCAKSGKLYFTPCIRNDSQKRYKTEHALVEEESACDKIPDAIFHGIGDGIDYLIIDTHPGFERINQVWLAMTSYLLIISRINDVDIENLKSHLQDVNVLDIKKKLVVFNNVTLNDERAAFKTMNNQKMQTKFLGLIQNPSRIIGSDSGTDTSVEIFLHPIPYSEALALYPSTKGLYIQKNKLSNFALIIKALATKILEDLPTE